MYEITTNGNFNELCKRVQNNLFKILILGEPGVGKTSIIKQTALKCFTPNYKATIGVDFVIKNVCYHNQILRMQLWDVAGQERLTSMTRVYYKDAVAAFIVYDQTRPDTFNSILKWKNDVDNKILLPDGSFIPCILMANKLDEPDRPGEKDAEELNAFCKKHGFTAWYKTSAKENIGIEEAFDLLADMLINQKDLYPYICPGEMLEAELINLAAAAAHEHFRKRKNYSTSNGIERSEIGQYVDKGTKEEHIEVQGFYKYKDGTDGKTYLVSYTSGKAGYRASTKLLDNNDPISTKDAFPDFINSALLASLNGG